MNQKTKTHEELLLGDSLSTILDEERRTQIFEDYYDLEQKLGGKGASQKTAELIVAATKK
jgi:lipid-A-disaccharide synthase